MKPQRTKVFVHCSWGIVGKWVDLFKLLRGFNPSEQNFVRMVLNPRAPHKNIYIGTNTYILCHLYIHLQSVYQQIGLGNVLDIPTWRDGKSALSRDSSTD